MMEKTFIFKMMMIMIIAVILLQLIIGIVLNTGAILTLLTDASIKARFRHRVGLFVKKKFCINNF